jgi:mono/diheme cytochrome c family protein
VRPILGLTICLSLAGTCAATYPQRSYRPAARPVYQQQYVTVTLLAEYVPFPGFDPAAYDFFVSPHPLKLPPPSLGLDANGREVYPEHLRPRQPQQPQPLQPLPQAKPAGPPPVVGYEGEDVSIPEPSPKAARLASLRAACASCHTQGGKTSGGFALFGAQGTPLAGVDWKGVYEEIEGGRMPPPTSGKPAVSADDLAELKRLAGK